MGRTQGVLRNDVAVFEFVEKVKEGWEKVSGHATLSQLILLPVKGKGVWMVIQTRPSAREGARRLIQVTGDA